MKVNNWSCAREAWIEDHFDADEPMMSGSDDEFSDLEDGYLKDVEDDDDGNSPAPPSQWYTRPKFW